MKTGCDSGKDVSGRTRRDFLGLGCIVGAAVLTFQTLSILPSAASKKNNAGHPERFKEEIDDALVAIKRLNKQYRVGDDLAATLRLVDQGSLSEGASIVYDALVISEVLIKKSVAGNPVLYCGLTQAKSDVLKTDGYVDLCVEAIKLRKFVIAVLKSHVIHLEREMSGANLSAESEKSMNEANDALRALVSPIEKGELVLVSKSGSADDQAIGERSLQFEEAKLALAILKNDLTHYKPN